MEAARFAPSPYSEPAGLPAGQTDQPGGPEFGLDPQQIDKLPPMRIRWTVTQGDGSRGGGLARSDLYPDGAAGISPAKSRPGCRWVATSLFSATVPTRCWNWWRMFFWDPARRRSWACMDLPSTSWSPAAGAKAVEVAMLDLPTISRHARRGHAAHPRDFSGNPNNPTAPPTPRRS